MADMLRINAMKGGFECVLKESDNGHRPYPAGHRSDETATGCDRNKIYISGEFKTLFEFRSRYPRHAHIYHHGPLLHHVGSDEIRPADGCNQDIRLQGDGFQIGGMTMSERDGAISGIRIT